VPKRRKIENLTGEGFESPETEKRKIGKGRGETVPRKKRGILYGPKKRYILGRETGRLTRGDMNKSCPPPLPQSRNSYSNRTEGLSPIPSLKGKRGAIKHRERSRGEVA